MMKEFEIQIGDRLIKIYADGICVSDTLLQLIRTHEVIAYFQKWDYCMIINESKNENKPT